MRRLRQIIVIFSFFSFMFINACVTPAPKMAANPSNPIRTVAVMPFINDTNDVTAPPYVREKFVEALGKYHYKIKSLKEGDQILKDQMGITLGAQLDMTTPKKLGALLGVDAVIFGILDNFDKKITGAYNVGKVRVRLKLVDCKTGQTVWKGGVGFKTLYKSALTSKVTSLVPFGLGEMVADKAMDVAMKETETGENLRPLLGDTMKAPWFRLPDQTIDLTSSVVHVASEDRNLLKNEVNWFCMTIFGGTFADFKKAGLFSAPPTVKFAEHFPIGPGI